MKKYHIIESTGTANRCDATVQKCPIGGQHFETKQNAEKFIEQKFDKEFEKTVTLKKNSTDIDKKKKFITLDLDLGNVEVEDGNLNNAKTRRILINGLCGDLAQAIYNKTGGSIYFVTYGYDEKDNEKFIKDIENNPDSIHETTTHVMIESSTQPGTFIDSYGQKTKEEIQSFYGFDNNAISMLKGNEKMLSYYHSGNSEKLEKFAEAVLKLDKNGQSFDYENYDEE